MAAPAETFPQHPQRWTLDEVLALPEDQGQRVELIDGTVVVSPAPGGRHQLVLHLLQVGMDGAVPSDCHLLPGVNVVLNGERMLIPDLVVTTNPDLDTVYFNAADILLAVEILSPSSRAYDRALKRQLYAEAAIPFFVIVDPVADPVSAIAYEFDGTGYRETVRSDNGVLKWERPFPVLVDLAR